MAKWLYTSAQIMGSGDMSSSLGLPGTGDTGDIQYMSPAGGAYPTQIHLILSQQARTKTSQIDAPQSFSAIYKIYLN